MTSDVRDLCYILAFVIIATVGLFGLALEILGV
jgi:hypothetical protein